MKNSYFNLSKDDTNALKAIAILLAVMHNFIHWLYPYGENEITFDIKNTYNFLGSLIDNPLNAANSFFVYLVIFVLQIFIFVSAYGLTKKHMKAKIDSYPKYLFARLIKIYGLLITGLLFLFFYTRDTTTATELVNIAIRYLTMTVNFSYDTLFQYVGPWWFFGLIVQLYIIFPLLLYIIDRFKEKGAIALFVFSYLLIYILYGLEDKTNFPVFANAIGRMPEFVLGICVAYFPSLKIDFRVALLAFAVFVVSCFSEYVFPFSFISILIVILYCSRPMYRLVREGGMGVKILLFIGNISMFMFLLNGPLRNSSQKWMGYFIDMNRTDNVKILPLEVLLAAILHTIFVIIVSAIFYFIYKEIAVWAKKYLKISLL